MYMNPREARTLLRAPSVRPAPNAQPAESGAPVAKAIVWSQPSGAWTIELIDCPIGS